MFCNKGQVVETSKDNRELKKTRYLKLIHSALFSIWVNAGVWSHWNPSFDMHLSDLGPVSHFCILCFLSSGLTMGSDCSLMATWWYSFLPEFPEGSPTPPSKVAVITDDEDIFCLLIWQEVLNVSIKSKTKPLPNFFWLKPVDRTHSMQKLYAPGLPFFFLNLVPISRGCFFFSCRISTKS